MTAQLCVECGQVMLWQTRRCRDCSARAERLRDQARREANPPSVRTTFWSDPENVEGVKRMWREGMSARQIAIFYGEALAPNADSGRNRILGKLDRLGLLGDATRSGVKPGPRRTTPRIRNRVPKAPSTGSVMGIRRSKPREIDLAALAFDETLAKIAREPDVVRVKSIIDLEADQCRYPVGDVGSETFGFCGDKRIEGISYCQKHAARCFGVEAPKPFAKSPTFTADWRRRPLVGGSSGQQNSQPETILEAPKEDEVAQ